MNRQELKRMGLQSVLDKLKKETHYKDIKVHPKKNIVSIVTNSHEIYLSIKTKQDFTWPHCIGCIDNHSFLILVDYEDSDIPDFYILNQDNWKTIVHRRVNFINSTRTSDKGKRRVDFNGIPYCVYHGHEHAGISISAKLVRFYKDEWNKIK